MVVVHSTMYSVYVCGGLIVQNLITMYEGKEGMTSAGRLSKNKFPAALLLLTCVFRHSLDSFH